MKTLGWGIFCSIANNLKPAIRRFHNTFDQYSKVFPIPITSRAVKVMGREFTNCPLDERNIALGYRSSFLDRHLF